MYSDGGERNQGSPSEELMFEQRPSEPVLTMKRRAAGEGRQKSNKTEGDWACQISPWNTCTQMVGRHRARER